MNRIGPPLWLYSICICALGQTTPAAPPPDPSQECRQTLETALQDKNPDTRKEAVIALSLTGGKQPWQDKLDSALADPDVQVRLAAIASLADLSGAETTALLRKALQDEVPEVSFSAAKALWTRNDPAGRDALLSVLSGDAKTSSNFFTRQKRDALRMMHTPRTMLLFAVREGAGFAPVPGLGAGVASMEALLFDPALSGRATAALLLGRDRTPATLEALRDALSAKEWSVRAAAVHSLSLRDDPSIKTLVLPLIHDKTEAVRLRAAAGYLRLETIQAAPHPAKHHAPRRPAAKG